MSKSRDAPSEESMIDIDDLELDLEVLRQPKIMRKWARKLAKARLVFNEAKANVDLVEAQMSKKVRKRPERFGMEKATDNSVKEAVRASDEYNEAVQAMNTAKYEMDMIEAMVTAVHHRKSALEMRIQLLVIEWHAEVREGKHSRRVGQEMRKKAVRRSLDD